MTVTAWHLWQRVGASVPAWGRFSLVIAVICGVITTAFATIMQISLTAG